MRNIFDERKLTNALREKLWGKYYQYFTAAVDVGYSPTFEFYSKELAADLYANIAQFSAFKARSFEKSLAEALWHKGDFISWNDFKKVGASINQDYNKNWLKTEYHQTVATANMAGKWADIERTKDLYPNLRYVTVGDERVRSQHREWDGIVLPIEHPFWKTHYPPNDWGCRCDVERTDDPVSTHIPSGQLKIEFENNAAQSGKIFSSSIYLTSGGFNPETIERIIDWSREMFRKAERYAKNYASYLKYKKNKDYTNVLFDKKTGGMQATHKLHNFDKRTGKYEKFLRDLFYKNGDKIILTDESSVVEGKKKVDGFLNGKSFDISSILGDGKNTIKRALNHSKNKPAEIAILYFPDAESFSMERLDEGIKMYNGQTKYRFKKIIYIVNNVVKYY